MWFSTKEGLLILFVKLTNVQFYITESQMLVEMTYILLKKGFAFGEMTW